MPFTISQKIMAKKIAKEFGVIDISKFSYGNLNNFNDAYYWTLLNIIETKNIKKVAYPNNSGGPILEQEYDIKKWLNIVYSIYFENKKTGEPILSLLEKYCEKLNKNNQEDANFKIWFKFYYNGENLKYSSMDGKMKKQALYIGNLGQSSSNYGHSSYDLPGSSFSMLSEERSADEPVTKAPITESESDKLKAWKAKVNIACRRIDRLLRESDYLSPDEFLELSQLLLSFSHKVMGVKLISTAQDLTYQFSNTLNKYAKNNRPKKNLKTASLIKNASDILIKTAQEAEQEEAAPRPPVEPSAATSAAGNQTVQTGTSVQPGAAGEATEAPADPAENKPQSPQEAMKNSIPGPDEVDPVELKDIEPIPGPKEGEYDDIIGDVKLDDAAKKLDEVAGMLSDRRIIRLLAEFDIMLDKIGIAAMFPELAEAQSKLIDGYSYALTRVTKMMGQLANAKMLLEAQSDGEVIGVENESNINPDIPTEEEME